MSRNLRSIALFAPNSSALHISVLLGIRKEFVRRGIDVHVGWHLLNEEQMHAFCDIFRPDAVIEIDRTRNEAAGVPSNVKSIAWIQDWRSVGTSDVGVLSSNFGGSDLNYFCVKPEAVGIESSKLDHWAYLLQATDPEVYVSQEASAECDFSLVGYIPAKRLLQSTDALARVHRPGDLLHGKPLCTIGEIVEAMRARGVTWNTYDAMEARAALNDFLYPLYKSKKRLLPRFWSTLSSSMRRPEPEALSNAHPAQDCLLSDETLYWIENEVMRSQARYGVVQSALKVSRSLRLFGVGEWQTYPEFSPYYRGPLRDVSGVRRVYAETRLNLHNAMTQMHSRVLDCMASGGAVMVNEMKHNSAESPDCLKAYFEEGLHYFEYNDGNFEERAREALADEERRKKVALSAGAIVRAQHTWKQRVDQIIRDLAQL